MELTKETLTALMNKFLNETQNDKIQRWFNDVLPSEQEKILNLAKAGKSRGTMTVPCYVWDCGMLKRYFPGCVVELISTPSSGLTNKTDEFKLVNIQWHTETKSIQNVCTYENPKTEKEEAIVNISILFDNC